MGPVELPAEYGDCGGVRLLLLLLSIVMLPLLLLSSCRGVVGELVGLLLSSSAV